MKIALVRPNSIIIASPAPLGPGYLAGFLRKRGQDQIEIIDGRRQRLSPDQVVYRLKVFQPDLVGISALTSEAGSARQLAQSIKSGLPQAIVVIGGAYASSLGEQVLEEPCYDFAVAGEGEETFFRAGRRA